MIMKRKENDNTVFFNNNNCKQTNKYLISNN